MTVENYSPFPAEMYLVINCCYIKSLKVSLSEALRVGINTPVGKELREAKLET